MIILTPNPEEYASQFAEKQQRLQALLAPFDPPALEAFASPPLHFRQRAEFKIWHEGDASHFAVFDRGAGQPPSFVTAFPVASESINALMPPLQASIEASDLLRRRLFQVEFLTTLTSNKETGNKETSNTMTGDKLVTLVYHKPLDEDWQQAAQQLATQLGCKIIGRSRKQKITLSDDWVTETFTVDNQPCHYRQLEGCFSQPNGSVCEKMLNWAVDASRSIGGDLLELYCGNGNFTLPLSRNFDRVLATEISKRLTATAAHNAAINQITNCTFVRLSAEEISAAMQSVRQFRRLADVDLDSYRFSTVFVDPPRAGLDEYTTNMVAGFDNILYISCNPETLADNLKALSTTHRIERLAFFDQFPYTHHMECGVLLKRVK